MSSANEVSTGPTCQFLLSKPQPNQEDPGTQNHDAAPVPDGMRTIKEEGSDIATVAPSSGGGLMIKTGKHKVIQVVDTSCQGDTAHSVGTDVIPAETDPCHPQTTQDSTSTQESLDCVDNNVKKEEESSLPAMMTDGMPCQHKKGGVCVLHGPGAKLRWKPVGLKIVTYENGRKKTTINKKYFNVCDLCLLGSGRKMKQ